MLGLPRDERWRRLSFLFSPDSNAPTFSATKRGFLLIYALLAALGIGAADYAIGQGITFLPLYLLVIVPLSFFESFLAGVAAAWVVSMTALGVDLISREPVPGYVLYVRTGLHFAMFVFVAATASWIARVHKGLKELSIRDGLTGLYNPRISRLASERSSFEPHALTGRSRSFCSTWTISSPATTPTAMRSGTTCSGNWQT